MCSIVCGCSDFVCDSPSASLQADRPFPHLHHQSREVNAKDREHATLIAHSAQRSSRQELHVATRIHSRSGTPMRSVPRFRFRTGRYCQKSQISTPRPKRCACSTITIPSATMHRCCSPVWRCWSVGWHSDRPRRAGGRGIGGRDGNGRLRHWQRCASAVVCPRRARGFGGAAPAVCRNLGAEEANSRHQPDAHRAPRKRDGDPDEAVQAGVPAWGLPNSTTVRARSVVSTAWAAAA